MPILEEVIGIAAAAFFAAGSVLGNQSIALMTSDALQAVTSDEVAAYVQDVDTVEQWDGTAGGMAAMSLEAANDAVRINREFDERQWYRSQIPMKKEHQKLLWDYCKERELDYIDMLALIALESNFDEKCKSTSGRYQGYFQISKIHWESLSETLNTPNAPLDGAVNINWGTRFYSWILMDERVRDLEGNAQRDVALSIYQRGSAGYNRNGLSKTYLRVFYNRRELMLSYFQDND